jgi:hypothetical protein
LTGITLPVAEAVRKIVRAIHEKIIIIAGGHYNVGRARTGYVSKRKAAVKDFKIVAGPVGDP